MHRWAGGRVGGAEWGGKAVGRRWGPCRGGRQLRRARVPATASTFCLLRPQLRLPPLIPSPGSPALVLCAVATGAAGLACCPRPPCLLLDMSQTLQSCGRWGVAATAWWWQVGAGRGRGGAGWGAQEARGGECWLAAWLHLAEVDAAPPRATQCVLAHAAGCFARRGLATQPLCPRGLLQPSTKWTGGSTR